MMVKFKRLNSHAVAPVKATEGAAAFDLTANIKFPVPIYAGKSLAIPTGISIELLPFHCGLVLPRSGLACKESITIANSPGLIDSDYRGEIIVYLQSHREPDLGSGIFMIEPGMRIAQLLIIGLPAAMMTEVGQLSESVRGSDGFGSTGR